MTAFRKCCWWFAVVLVAGVHITCTDALRCLSCQDVSGPEVCETVQHCGEHEICYADVSTSPNGILTWNLGCRDTLQCSDLVQTSSSGGQAIVGQSRTVSRTLVCAACCSSDACALSACGKTGPPDRPDRGPFCFTCDTQSSPEACDSFRMCGRDEHCLLKVEVANTYTSGCSNEQTCKSNYNFFKQILVGRRDGPLHNIGSSLDSCVSKCCDGDFCNNGCTGAEVVRPTSSPPPASVDSFTTPPTTIENPTKSSITTRPTIKPTTTIITTTSPTIKTTTMQTVLASTHKEEILTGPCASSPCVVGQCESSGPFYHCICPDGYSGTNCQIAPDPCERNPCIHGNCTGYSGRYECACEYGYYGQHCELHVDPCFSNPCVHGNCSSFGEFFSCACPSGYSGLDCKIPPSPCASNPCMHGTCIDHDTSFTCACPTDYSGLTCEIERNPCWSNPCIHGTCSRLGDGYSCNCTGGYTGTNCELFPDACRDGPCKHGTCHKYLDSYTCECDPGFLGHDCDQTPNPCVSNPCSHGICIQNETSFYCNCSDGYTGATCQIEPDPCDVRPCLNNGVCMTNGTGYLCDCISGFKGERCHLPPNPCVSNPCSHGTCVQNDTSYFCNCTDGYTGASCQKAASPCHSNPCIHGNCSSNGTSFTCECEPGYTNRTCDSVYCYKDVLFIVDDSGSVGQANFNYTLYAIAEVIKQLNIGATGTRTAFESFSTQPQIRWGLSDHYDTQSTLDALGKVDFLGGQTNFEPALMLAAQILTNGTGERPDAENVVILMSDGGEIVHNQQHFHHHQILSNISHDVIALVTTETQASSVDLDTMKELAMDQQHFLSAKTYRDLMQLVPETVRLICG